jgi:DNA-binding GntR family transcriptional regulator
MRSQDTSAILKEQPARMAPLIRRSLHHEIVERLRDMIIEGDLEPGAKIPETALSAQFNVSRLPIREALKVLASEGLVVLNQQRGATVAVITLPELNDLFPVMGALERLAGELACANITDDEVEYVRGLHHEMVKQWRSGDLSRYFALNQAIHRAIFDASRNIALMSCYQSLSGRIRRARYVANRSADRWAQAVREHDEILSYLEQRNAEGLGQVLQSHLRNKFEIVEEWINGSLPSGGTPE